jgi:hypothetical protein
MGRGKQYQKIAMGMTLLLLAACADEGADDNNADNNNSADNSNGEDDNSIADPNDPGSPLWTVRALISGEAPGGTEGDIRAAFVWQSSDLLRVADDIVIGGGAPFELELEIHNLPDTAWLISSNETWPHQFGPWGFDTDEDDQGNPVTHPEVRWTLGKLLIYEDLNQNGALDVLDVGDDDAIDRIVGGAFAYEFYYIESDVANPFISAPEITTGLLAVSVEEDPYYRRPLSLEEDIVIDWDNSDRTQRYLCPNLMHQHWIDGMHTRDKICTIVEPSELLSYFPSGILLNVDGHCANEGQVFEWFALSVMDEGGGVCSSALQHGDYFISRVPVGDPMPSYWPCDPADESSIGMTYVEEWHIEEGWPGEFTGAEACYALIEDLASVQ